jgi:hypothetical protein
MTDISKIKTPLNISSISGGGGGGNYYSNQENLPKQEKKHSKLRIGEVVRATILDRIDSELAYVRIPTGTFKALIGKNLKKDDSLFFKVNETSPYLVLKIYEVPTGRKETIFPTEELIRILDVPQNEFYLELIELFRLYKNTIVREDLLNIYKVYQQFNSINKHNLYQTQFLRLAVELNISKLPLSINLIKKLFPLYINENEISECLNYLDKNINELPEPIKSKLFDIFDDVKKNKYNKNNLFILAISENQNQKTFFELLNEIDEYEFISKSYKNKSNVLRNFIGALSLWNIISFSGKAPLQYFIPYYFEGYYFIIRITKRNYTNNKLEPVSFNFSVPTENVGEVKSKMLAFQKQLKLYMSNDNNKFIESLDNFKEKLITSLEKNNYNLSTLKLSVDDISKELNEINKFDNASHFTIVV